MITVMVILQFQIFLYNVIHHLIHMEPVSLVVYLWCVNYPHSFGSFLSSPVWILPLPFVCMRVPKWVMISIMMTLQFRILLYNVVHRLIHMEPVFLVVRHFVVCTTPINWVHLEAILIFLSLIKPPAFDYLQNYSW